MATVQAVASIPKTEAGRQSYGRILKSSALIGGSTAVNMLFTLVRTKAMALLLGPSGIGLLGVYSSIADLVRSIAGLGINTSGVRQIAEAVGTGEAERVSCTVITLRRVAFYSGSMGALLLILFSRPISWVTFHDYQHIGTIASLGIATFLLDISDAQSALVQGMRRITDLARINVFGGLFAAAVSIAVVYMWRERGIVPCLIATALISIATSWWYAHKIKIESIRISWGKAFREASELVKLGFLVMTNGLATLAAAYVIRLFVLRTSGLKSVGYYQAAWGVSAVCISFILQAMGSDYYPRLTAVSNNRNECNRLMNEQVEVGMLMAAPAMLIGLSLAPVVVTLLYSARFGGAVEIFRWFSIGMFLRVITWPIGYIILAKGERKIFFCSGVLANSVYLILAWIGLRTLHLTGIGVAFFVLQVLHNLAIFLVARHLTGFTWSAANMRLAAIMLPLLGIVFGSWYFLSPIQVAVLGTLIGIPAAYYSLKTLCGLLPSEQLLRPTKKLGLLLGFSPR